MVTSRNLEKMKSLAALPDPLPPRADQRLLNIEQIPKHEVTLNGDDNWRSCEHCDSNDDSDDFLHTGKSTSENENSFAKGKI